MAEEFSTPNWQKITKSFSYGSLENAEQKNQVQTSPRSIEPKDSTDSEKKRLSAKASWKAGQPVSAVHAHNIKHLLSKNPSLFQYLDDNKRQALKEDLLLAHQNLCLRYQFFEIEGRHQDDNFVNIMHCAYLIRQINLKPGANSELHRSTWNKKKAQLILDEQNIHFWNTGKVEYGFEKLGIANTWRLYWVWTGLMVRAGLENGYVHYGNIEQALNAARYPKMYMDFLSYSLYFLRGSINFLFALKHTLRFAWMSDQEKEMVDEMGGWTRFWQQLVERKYTLLNDFIWATSNLLGAVKFIGGTPLGPYGDILTVILLIMDYELAKLGFAEALEEKNQDIQQYSDEIALLLNNIIALQNQPSTSENQKKIEILLAQLGRLEEAKAQYEKEWGKKSLWYHSQQININYSFGLIVAFTMLVFPWENFLTGLGYATEIAGPMAINLAFAGAFALFVLSWAQTSYQAYLEVSRAREAQENALKQCQEILNGIVGRKIKNDEYITFRDLEKQALYQNELIQYQFKSFMRTSLLQFCTPIIIYGAFAFATVGVGCALLALWLTIAAGSYYKIGHKPTAPENNSEPVGVKSFKIDDETKKLNTALKDASHLSITLGIFSSTGSSDSVKASSLNTLST